MMCQSIAVRDNRRDTTHRKWVGLERGPALRRAEYPYTCKRGRFQWRSGIASGCIRTASCFQAVDAYLEAGQKVNEGYGSGALLEWVRRRPRRRWWWGRKWWLSRPGISDDEIPVRVDVPVLADTHAAGQLRKFLHVLRVSTRRCPGTMYTRRRPGRYLLAQGRLPRRRQSPAPRQ